MSKSEKRVMVGLSGGVDSSVAALRLINAGYDVVGVFIKVWQPDWLKCDWEQERIDAMKVAAHLNIPFLTCDAEETYKREVADYLIESYQAGITPNPDVMCNRHVKFGCFWEFAKDYGAKFIATGHYAINGEIDGKPALMRGKDIEKDQSYFLWTLTEEDLSHILFPTGLSEKTKVREEALKAGLPTAKKKDSQGICFLGQVDMREFLSHYIKLETGFVVNKKGETVGEHSGALTYTLGQRHGFSIKNQTDDSAPWYVVGKDVTQNLLIVDTVPSKLQEEDEVKLINTNWIQTLKEGGEYEAQFRYRQKPFRLRVEQLRDNEAILHQPDSVEAPASGQSCVLYKGDVCIGGGIIS
jgi:tRNA-specific 2-thiouridylase